MARVKLNRFNVKKPSPEILDHYWRLVDSKDLHFRLDDLPPIDSPTLFGNDQPLVIDLGCGRGDYLNALSRENPAINFLGFDLHYKSLWDAISKAHAAGIDNVRFVRGDFRRALRLVPAEVALEVSLLFPPPVLKPSKVQRDPLPEDVIPEIARVLVTDGLFRFVTDSPEYFERKVDLIKASDLFEPALEVRRIEGGVTRFQQFWEQFEIESKRFEGRKRPTE